LPLIFCLQKTYRQIYNIGNLYCIKFKMLGLMKLSVCMVSPCEFRSIVREHCACTGSFQIHSRPDQVVHRNILAILDSSMKDHPQETGAENEMRYKLIIDSSEDNSVIRLLFSTGVLRREKTRMYMCSDFHGDSQLQKVQ
jgi:hypothetical protein